MLFAPDPRAARRVLEFFTAHIRNPHTRKAYAEAAAGFAAWCDRVVLHRHKAPKRGSAGSWGRVAQRKRLRSNPAARATVETIVC